MQIGNSLLEARTALPTTPGQQLSLEVVRADEQIILRIIPIPPPAEPTLEALRKSLPQQLPLAAAFSRFTEILAASPSLTPAVTALLEQLLQQLPDAHTITQADTLKEALMDSGLFLERKLDPGLQPSSLSKDIKANLLRLLAELTQVRGDAAADLTRHVEAALARIQLHQLAAVTQGQAPAAWAGELPVRHDNHINVFQFRIEKDAHHSADAAQQSWHTWLSFSLKTLGPLHVKITLANRSIAAAMWAESSATADLVNEHLNYLHQSLDKLGLEVKGIHCLHGRPPFIPLDRLPKGLVDLSA